MKNAAKWPGTTRRRRYGIAVAVVALLGAFGLTACQPNPADVALRMTVTDTAASDAPAANVTVSVYPAADTNAPATANGITDENGNVYFTHDQLPAGDYVVNYGAGSSTTWYPDATTRSAATAVTVTDTSPTQITGTLAVTAGYISGNVDDSAGNGIGGVKVTAYDAATGKQVGSARTVPNGAVGLYFLYPTDMQGGPLHLGQTYKIGFSKSGYATEYVGAGGTVAYALADAAAVAAGNPGHVSVDAELQPESTITGTVTDGTNPIGGAVVVAFVASTGSGATYTTTAADGTFTLRGLSGTGYHLAFLPPSGVASPMILGAGGGPGASLNPADGSTFSLQTGGNLALGTVSLDVGADCAAAQGGTSTDLSYADLHNCDLATADLTSTDLYGAKLSGANLSNATLPDYSLIQSPSLGGATLVGTNLSSAQSPSSGATKFGSANLTGADLSHASCESCDLSGSQLVGANLSHTDLSHGGIDGSDVSGADLSATTFLYTDTDGLTWSVEPTIPAGYRLIGTNLVGAGVALQSVDLSGQDLSGLNLDRLWLTQVNLTNANLTNTTLTNITWNVVDLSSADLSGATLSVSYSAHLTSDASTILPTGWSIVNGSFQQN